MMKLVVINALAVMFITPLFEGAMRKFKALIHSRQGPPWLQIYYDILKLLGKEEMGVKGGWARYAPVLSFGIILVAALLIPMGWKAPLGEYSDIIVFIYVIGISAVMIAIAGMGTGTPYAVAGSAREVMLLLTVEPVMIVALITAAINAGSMKFADITAWHMAHGTAISMVVCAIAFFLALQVQAGKLPFDIPEADQEIMGGPFVELSGPRYAMFKWTIIARQFVFISVFLEVFIPWPKTGVLWADFVIHCAKVLAVMLFIALVDVVNPRVRIDHAMKYFMGAFALSFAGLAFSIMGV